MTDASDADPADGSRPTAAGAPSDRYVHGHHESVLRSHTWRTVENSAAYLAPHLVPGIDVLDVGCGPGTVTVDLAARVAPGTVIGIDAVRSVLDQASELANEQGVGNVTFEADDVYHLSQPDERFDVVHAHQVLQHLSDPVAALREMRRVTRTNGIVAVRDADYAAMTWAPADPALDRWLDLYHRVTRLAGAEADAGRYLLGWAQQAGFSAVTASSSTWTFATPSERAWWGGLWADRVLHSDFAGLVLENELTDRSELEAIAEAWHQWSVQDDGWFVVVHGEILAVR